MGCDLNHRKSLFSIIFLPIRIKGFSTKCRNIFDINIVIKEVIIKKGMNLNEKLNFNKSVSK